MQRGSSVKSQRQNWLQRVSRWKENINLAVEILPPFSPQFYKQPLILAFPNIPPTEKQSKTGNEKAHTHTVVSRNLPPPQHTLTTNPLKNLKRISIPKFTLIQSQFNHIWISSIFQSQFGSSQNAFWHNLPINRHTYFSCSFLVKLSLNSRLMPSKGGYAAAPPRQGGDRFYNPPAVRRQQILLQQQQQMMQRQLHHQQQQHQHQHQEQQLQQQRQMQRTERVKVKAESSSSTAAAEKPTDGGDSSVVAALPVPRSVSPASTLRVTNLDRLMESVTPFIEARYSSEVYRRTVGYVYFSILKFKP